MNEQSLNIVLLSIRYVTKFYRCIFVAAKTSTVGTWGFSSVHICLRWKSSSRSIKDPTEIKFCNLLRPNLVVGDTSSRKNQPSLFVVYIVATFIENILPVFSVRKQIFYYSLFVFHILLVRSSRKIKPMEKRGWGELIIQAWGT